MDQSKTSLYKNTLYLASGIFVFLMFAATTSPARVHPAKPSVVASTAPDIATLGRFVGTPSATHFVSASSSATGQQSRAANASGAL